MSLVAFDPNEVEAFYQNYYQLQDGNGLSVFRGKRVMDGDGLGSLLSGAFEAVAPALKGLAKSAVGTLGKTAIGVAADALRGHDAGESASQSFRSAGASILDSAGSAFDGIGGDDEAPPAVIRKELKRKAPRSKKKRSTKRTKTIF